MADQCSHLGQVDAEAEPSSPGCEDCLRDGSRWVHLRMCRVCGHVGLLRLVAEQARHCALRTRPGTR